MQSNHNTLGVVSTGAPSSWIQSTWKGDQFLQTICTFSPSNGATASSKSLPSLSSSSSSSLLSPSKRQTVGTVGLYAVFGSWNGVPKKNHAGLLRLFDLLLQDHARSDVDYCTGCVQVDSCEDELELCCGNATDNNDSSNGNGKQEKNHSTTTTQQQQQQQQGHHPHHHHHHHPHKINPPCPPEHLPALLVVLKRTSMKEPEIRYLSAVSPDNILRFWKRNDRSKTIPDAAREEIHHLLQSFGLGSISTSSTIARATIPLHSTVSAINAIATTATTATSTPSQALRIFIAGDRMSVGKTSVCLGLLGSLVRMGYPTESLAYIKPATQNEKPQLVQLYCERMGIPCVPVGPIVYYRGFTRAFLAGETESTEELLTKVSEQVDQLAQGKKVVIVDGVGFPAVGSICGTDNASVARASGYPIPNATNGDDHNGSSTQPRRRPMGVLLVGGPGVGGAVDGFNLNATYFENAHVPVLGGIFNKLSLEGFYSLENCKSQITAYFNKNEHQQRLGRQPFGFVPLFPGLVGGGDAMKQAVFDYIKIFEEHVDMNAILIAARNVQDQSFPEEMDVDESMDIGHKYTVTSSSSLSAAATSTMESPAKRIKVTGKRTRTREEIEMDAIGAGAAPSA